MNAESTLPHAGVGHSPRVQVGPWLAGVAAVLGAAIVVAAAVIPVVTLQSPPATSAASLGSMPTSTPSGAPVLTTQPRVTLVAHDGVAVLGVAAIPLLVAVAVGLLLWYAVREGSRPAVTAAWTFAVALTAAAVVGFVTILIGVIAIPVCVLLIIACTQTTPKIPRTSGRRP